QRREERGYGKPGCARHRGTFYWALVLGSWCLVPSPLNRGQKGLPTITYPSHRHASHSGRTCGRRRGGDDVGGGRVLVRAAGAIAARIGATDSRPLAHDHAVLR